MVMENIKTTSTKGKVMFKNQTRKTSPSKFR